MSLAVDCTYTDPLTSPSTNKQTSLDTWSLDWTWILDTGLDLDLDLDTGHWTLDTGPGLEPGTWSLEPGAWILLFYSHSFSADMTVTLRTRLQRSCRDWAPVHRRSSVSENCDLLTCSCLLLCLELGLGVWVLDAK